MYDLKGHTAFVSGASHGIGRAISVSLAQAGAGVVLHGLEHDEHAETTIELCRSAGAPTVDFVAQDFSISSESVSRFAETLPPEIDMLVNNAGGYFDDAFLDMDVSVFEKTMQLNVFSYFVLTQHFARRWVKSQTRGRVLMVGSINGRLAERTHVAYDTSKGAVEMLVKSTCVELAPFGIRVNGLAPGLFYTPLTASALDDPRERSWMELHTPNGRVPGPEVAGDAAVFLLSDAAEHVHGQMLLVDGGMSIWQQPPAPPSAL